MCAPGAPRSKRSAAARNLAPRRASRASLSSTRDQPGVAGLRRAEGPHARAADARRRREPLELGSVAIEDRGSARLEAEKDLRLGVGDRFERAEIFDMDRRDRGDQRRMRADHAHQRRDLAGVVHADLEDAEFRAGRQARKRQRHAPVIVVGGRRGVRFAARAEHRPQHLLGAGLADRAGDGDDPRRRARPGRNGRGAPSPSASRRPQRPGPSAARSRARSRCTTAAGAPASKARAT